MKVKRVAQDFVVEELPGVEPAAEGPFAFYRLYKEGLGTPEAIRAICRKWRLPPRQVSYGGLKDRHACTTQYLTIRHGPRRGLQQTHLRLDYLGQRPEPYHSSQIAGNRFLIVLRDLAAKEVEHALEAAEEVRADGVPNYFDDQRFGSVNRNRQFVARFLIAGDYPRALQLALAEPYRHDPAPVREQKRLLRQKWGRWDELADRLGGELGPIVAHLRKRPDDYRGAFALIAADLKSLYLAAFQSYLWNKMLAGWLRSQCRPEQLLQVRLQLGPVPVFRRLTPQQRDRFRQQTLPLPSARLHLAENDPLRPLIDEVLQEEGLTLKEMKLRHFREPFFSKGDRAAVFHPRDLTAERAADELHPGREKLTLRFVLPRGSYATMLLKRITAVPPEDA
jgi:tRNA pseudouridine13 synthase